VTSAAALQAEFDFQGQKLTDMWDANVDADVLAHPIMATERGGSIVFAWKSGDAAPATTVNNDAFADEDKGDISVQYCFLNAENTFILRAWWEVLDQSLKDQLTRYAQSLHYEGGAFVANVPKLVDWIFL